MLTERSKRGSIEGGDGAEEAVHKKANRGENDEIFSRNAILI